jgi:two-component system cell cycle sensor histidine kinase/response regulator CckA
MLGAVSQMLMLRGYEVLSAARAHQALEIVSNGPSIHLIVADLLLPEMKGTQLIREVLRLSPHTACLLMTYGIDAPGVPDGVALLRKPFSSQELFRVIQAALATEE